jgi:hypothetical protein
MIRTLITWLKTPAVEWGLGIFSILAVVASVLLVPRFLARLPVDYLTAPDHASRTSSMPVRVFTNLLGVVLVLLGIAMLLLPGQGLLTLLVGVLLLDFPGKTALVQRLMKRPKVLAVVNKLRQHRGSPPLAT